ncbi:MAG: phosphatase PAP2 family protein [Bacteroidetes bacterium]|nr:MAG: phosphatase PAP2 family protein [Bacteroidota bacterium]
MNRKKKYLFSLCLLGISLSSSLFSQTPYALTLKKELIFAGSGLGSMGLGAYLRTLPKLFTPNELRSLDPDDINALDRLAIANYSMEADQVSNVFLIGAHVSPFLFLAGKQSRAHIGQIMVMYGEAATLNLGLTVITKSLFHRPRPFVFNSAVPEEVKLSRNAKASFVSGHASMVALNTFFFAKVFSDYYPHSKWKPLVWGAAATIPAVTAYLRIAAGKHYPTDVLAGYALGAAVGILVPHFHRTQTLAEKGISLGVGYNSLRLSWRF